MKQIIGHLETSISPCHARPTFSAYVQVWEVDPKGGGKTPIISKQFNNLTSAQWERFRRLQSKLATRR